MSEKICGTCEHWYAPWHRRLLDAFTPTDDGKVFGNCGKIVNTDHRHGSVDTSEEAWVADHEEFSATLLCKPTFGCVLHEPRRSADRPADG